MHVYLRTLLITTSFGCFTTTAMEKSDAMKKDGFLDPSSPKHAVGSGDAESDSDRKQVAYQSSGCCKSSDYYKGYRCYTVPTFKRQTITSCAMSPNEQLLVHGFERFGVTFTLLKQGRSIYLHDNDTYGATSVAFAPKEQCLASGQSLREGGEHWLKMYYDLDPSTITKTIKNCQLPVSDPISSLCYTHDGDTVAVGLANGSAHLRKVSALASISQNFGFRKSLILDSRPIETLAYADDNSFCCAMNTALVFFDPREHWSGRIPGHTSPISRVATAPTHPGLIASGDEDGAVKLWDVRTTKKALWTVTVLSKVAITALALHPRYKQHVLMGNKSGTMCIITGKHGAVGFGQSSPADAPVSALATTHDGNWMMSTSSDGTYKLYGPRKSIAALHERWTVKAKKRKRSKAIEDDGE